MIRRPWPQMSLKLHHLLLSQLHDVRYPDLTFASGEGSQVLACAKRLWRYFVPNGMGPMDTQPPLFAGLSKRFRR